MTEATSNKPADLTDIEKSAVVMMSIGQEAAASIVKSLSQPEINRLSMAMARISKVPKHTAASVLKEAFPSRRIVPIDCRELIWGLGAFHCLTQQQPAP